MVDRSVGVGDAATYPLPHCCWTAPSNYFTAKKSCAELKEPLSNRTWGGGFESGLLEIGIESGLLNFDALVSKNSRNFFMGISTFSPAM